MARTDSDSTLPPRDYVAERLTLPLSLGLADAYGSRNDTEVLKHIRDAARIVQARYEQNDVFLTVVLRTQCRRPDTLRDSLLCLAAQTDQDFELVIVAHDAEEEDLASLRETVDQYRVFFQNRIQVIPVHGGTRGRPINAGIAAAAGQYVAFYDDDDVLFAHWVESFREAAEDHPMRILRANTAVQEIQPELASDGAETYRTLSLATKAYPSRFSILEHLTRNFSPFMSLAFPRVLATEFGIQADEELVVCEDWDLLLRGAALVGVADVPHMTSIYRRWQGGASSYSRHDQDAWRASEQRVRSRIDTHGAYLPPHQLDHVAQILSSDPSGPELENILRSRTWRVARKMQVVTHGLKVVAKPFRTTLRAVTRR